MRLPELVVDAIAEVRLCDGASAPHGHALSRARLARSICPIVNEAAFLNPYLGNGFVSLRPDAIVVDVGANIGDFTIRPHGCVPAGRVIAVEPLRSRPER